MPPIQIECPAILPCLRPGIYTPSRINQDFINNYQFAMRGQVSVI